MDEKELREKPLYTCESIVDGEEYKKTALYFPEIYWGYVLGYSILIACGSIICWIMLKNFVGVLIFAAVCEILILIICKVTVGSYAEQIFKNNQKKGLADTHIHTEFYEDYFIRQGETIAYKIKYSDIIKYIETPENIYLKSGKKNLIVIFQKSQCTPEVIQFIGGRCSNIEKHLKESKKPKEVKGADRPLLVKRVLLFLFIVTLISLWGAMFTMQFALDITHAHGFDFVKMTWVFWLWLPIPILSIIFGIKYKRAGFKCTKNIVAGVIMGFLLAVYGAFWMIPTFSEDYNQNISQDYHILDSYKLILGVELPDNGDLTRQYYGEYFEPDKTEYAQISVYYDQEDTSRLEAEIIHNENWISGAEMKSNLKVYMPSMMIHAYDENDYLSFYNKTLGTYNTLPEKAGNYEVYAMRYDVEEKYLEICEFKYTYK